LIVAIISFQLATKKPAPVSIGSNSALGGSTTGASGARSALTMAQPESNMGSAQLPNPEGPSNPQPSVPQGSAPPPTPAPVRPAWKDAHDSAQHALHSGAFLQAVTEARRARAQGDPSAQGLEEQALEGLLQGVRAARQARDYNSALVKVSSLIDLFPNRSDLQQMRLAIQQEQQDFARQQLEEQRRAEQERQKQAYDAKFARFTFNHRHIVMGPDGKMYTFYCQGLLSVSPEGVVQYDCQRTNDPQGRCDHVTWVQGSIRQVKISRDGSLHLATANGNFDMFGNAGDVQQAMAAITPLAAGRK